MMQYLYPLRRSVIWGGGCAWYGTELPCDTGELWLCADTPGVLPSAPTPPSTPIFTKIIDTSAPLSIQVHPSCKNEFWYILDAAPNAFLYFDSLFSLSSEQLREKAENGTICEVLHRIPVKKGDAFYIPSGMIHAIGSGITLCEIQQSADVTYRLYDYDRRDADGNPRPLHLDAALPCIRHFIADELNKLQFSGHTFSDSINTICDSEQFAIAEIPVDRVQTVDVPDKYGVMFCTEGSVRVCDGTGDLQISKGECLSFDRITRITLDGDGGVLLAVSTDE